jgi:hypothetical protein
MACSKKFICDSLFVTCKRDHKDKFTTDGGYEMLCAECTKYVQIHIGSEIESHTRPVLGNKERVVNTTNTPMIRPPKV